jgi:RNA polymerase sigma-70 factor (ECF subfamily)
MERTLADVADQVAYAGHDFEHALVERARCGDSDAFAALVERRLPTAFRTASAILGNEADAYDAVQESFVSAWVNLPRLRGVDRFDAWLNRIVLNRCRDALRQRRRSREMVLDEHVLPIAPMDGDVASLSAAFDRLSVEQRNLLVLHHLHHEPVAEVARKLGIPVGTAKWRLHAARRALERALEAER